MATFRAETPDEQIQQEVLRELQWDTRVQGANVWVEVDQGVVTLAGTVATYAAKVAAQEAAHRVAGVLDVANDLQVKPPASTAMTDTDIAFAVRQTLEWDASLPADRIRSTVSDGVVTLEGVVDFVRQRQDAERAVHRLKGLCGIRNKILVCPPGQRPARAAIRAVIEHALVRQMEREAGRIGVAVQGGTVTLSGLVHSYAEKRAVLGAAGHAPGVQAVEDRLVVAPAG